MVYRPGGIFLYSKSIYGRRSSRRRRFKYFIHSTNLFFTVNWYKHIDNFYTIEGK